MDGQCPQCLQTFRKLGSHKCPVQKLRENLPRLPELVQEAPAQECSGCGAVHLVQKNCNAFRHYKGHPFCSQCYRGRGISSEISNAWHLVAAYLLSLGRTVCYLCSKLLLTRSETFDPGGLRCSRLESQVFELHHLNPGTKSRSVFELISWGEPLEAVLAETKTCTPVCVPCHSYLTLAERQLGLHHPAARLRPDIFYSPEVLKTIYDVALAFVHHKTNKPAN